MKLMIVESPGKTKKLQSFLGKDWMVRASVGHVRDLPEKEMGVEAPEFKPKYEIAPDKKDVVKNLIAAVAKADEVYLASDPDREGEAIAWHLARVLGLKTPKRITFQEISEKAVKAAISKPRGIDMNLVAAQEGRRVLDRLCGYMVSGPLSDASGQRLSAGRVQSPAVRLVVERDREIKNFQSVTHYGAALEFAFPGGVWAAEWKPKLKEGEKYFLDREAAARAAEIRNLKVASYQESKSQTAPPAPFTTSSLQQAASNALKFNPKTTMGLAQSLYEKGHITYLRTDSPNLSDDFIKEARAFCADQGLPVVEKPRNWKAKGNAQEAHEAIRPTHIAVEEAGENDAEKALYKLIRTRTLACMLADAVYAVRTVKLLSVAGSDGVHEEFEGKGRTLVESGWKIIMKNDDTDDDESGEPSNPIPTLKDGESITAQGGELLTKKTQPPKRYTEASLVKELEKRGIGRPATYAAILDNIMHREYIATEKRLLVPQPKGEIVVDSLAGVFKFMEYEFTKKMEDDLDAIAEGKEKYITLVQDLHLGLKNELALLNKKTESSGEPCPCGKGTLHRKSGKDGTFWWGCSEYNKGQGCKNSYPDKDGKPNFEAGRAVSTEHKCLICGKGLVRKLNKTDNSFFWGCSGYPDCKKAYPDKDGKPDYEARNEASKVHKCQTCGKGLVRRKNRQDDGWFWGCSGWKDGDCKQTYPDLDGKPDYSK
jgi:DNA topoisomerase-1